MPCWYRCSKMAICRICCCFSRESHTASETTPQISESKFWRGGETGPCDSGSHFSHWLPEKPCYTLAAGVPAPSPGPPTCSPCQWLCPLGRHCCECPCGLKPVSARCLLSSGSTETSPGRGWLREGSPGGLQRNTGNESGHRGADLVPASLF